MLPSMVCLSPSGLMIWPQSWAMVNLRAQIALVLVASYCIGGIPWGLVEDLVLPFFGDQLLEMVHDFVAPSHDRLNF